MEKKIKSLADLQNRKKELKIQMEVSKREFAQGVVNTKDQSTSFLINKVAIPLGVAGIVGFGLYKLLGGKKKKAKAEAKEVMSLAAASPEKKSLFDWQQLLLQFLPIGIQLAKNYFLSPSDNNENLDD